MIKSKRYSDKIEIGLTVPDGNAFYLLARAGSLYKQVGSVSNKSWEELRAEMTSGDYENLIKVFDEEFGEWVDLVR